MQGPCVGEVTVGVGYPQEPERDPLAPEAPVDPAGDLPRGDRDTADGPEKVRRPRPQLARELDAQLPGRLLAAEPGEPGGALAPDACQAGHDRVAGGVGG